MQTKRVKKGVHGLHVLSVFGAHTKKIYFFFVNARVRANIMSALSRLLLIYIFFFFSNPLSFAKTTNGLEQCQQLCSAEDACLGVYFYNSSKRCKGLSRLGNEGVATDINADSYTKILLWWNEEVICLLFFLSNNNYFIIVRLLWFVELLRCFFFN